MNSFDDAAGWEGRNGPGEVVWSRPHLLDIRQEGFLGEVSETVTVINACRERDDIGACGGVDGSQQWEGIEPFSQECCGAGDFIWVGRDSGVVFAVNQNHVRVWYPQDRSDATIEVALNG